MLPSCADDNDDVDGGTTSGVVSITSVTPETSAASGVELYGEMSLGGQNIDLITNIEVCGVSVLNTSLTGSTKVTFTIPNSKDLTSSTVVDEETEGYVEYAGVRYETVIQAFTSDGTLVYNKPIYVDVPTTTPYATTDLTTLYAGMSITLNGFVLTDVDSVTLSSDDWAGDVVIAASDFTSVGENELIFTLPTSTTYERGDNESVTMSLDYDSDSFVVADDLTLLTPKVAEYPSTGAANTTYTLTGDNLNLLADITFGYGTEDEFECNIEQRSTTEVKFHIVSLGDDDGAASYNFTQNLDGWYGEDVNDRASFTIVEFTLDATPADPVLTEADVYSGTIGTVVTLSGSNLYLATGLELENRSGDKIDLGIDDFSGYTTSIEFTVPKSAYYTDARNVLSVVLSYGADSTTKLADSFTVLLPEVTSAAASGKYGEELTISGINLDLITSVDFVADADSEAYECEISVNEAGTLLTYTIPFDWDYVTGDTAAGKIVGAYGENDEEADNETLDLISSFTLDTTTPTPAITSISPESATIGETVTLTGTDLDFVKEDGILFGTLAVDEFTLTDATSLSFVVPGVHADYSADAIEGNSNIEVSFNGTATGESVVVSIPAITTTAFNNMNYDTETTIEGFNLDLIDVITYGADAVECAINEASTATELKFTLPYDEDNYGETDVYSNTVTATLSFFYGETTPQQATTIYPMTVLVTPPTPTVETISYDTAKLSNGSVVTLTGEYLDYITSLKINTTTIASSAFTTSEADEVSFTFTSDMLASIGTSEYSLFMSYQVGENAAVADADTGKTIQAALPIITTSGSYAATTGIPFTIEGTDLDLISAVTYTYFDAPDVFNIPCTIGASSTATALVVTIPYDASYGTSGTLYFDYGYDASDLTRSPLLVSITLTVEEPTMYVSGIEITDGVATATADNGVYLNSKITITGSGLEALSDVMLGGVAVTATEVADDKYVFTVPYSTDMEFDQTSSVESNDNDYTFDTATKMSLTYGSESTKIADLKVYPFYYYKDVTLGMGTGSTSSYTAYAHANAFFMLNSGTVISASDWYNNDIDPYAKSGSNTIITSANTIKKENADATMENYYSVKPNFFVNCTSAGKLSLLSASNSSSALKTHYRYDSSYTALPSAYGTSIMGFRNITSDTDDALVAIKAGTLETINESAQTSSATPALGKVADRSTSVWNVDDVLMFSYATFTWGAPKPYMPEGRLMGYIHITDMTCGDADTGLTDRDTADYAGGYLKFDVYVSPERNLDK